MKCKNCQYYVCRKPCGFGRETKHLCIRPAKTIYGFIAIAEQDVHPEMECNYITTQEERKHA